MSWPRERRPAEGRAPLPSVVRVMGHTLVLSIMIGSSVLVGNALRSENATPSPGMGSDAGPNAEEPAPEDPEPEEPPAQEEEPEDRGPALPTPQERHDASSGFRHPGVFVTLSQLEYVRDQVRKGRQPWKRAYDQMRNSPYADLNWQPQPRAFVECGYYSNPDNGCRDEWRDAVAAYTHALMWSFTGNEDHARKGNEIINAWANTLQAHTHQNAPLQAGWSGATMVRAAELLRYTTQWNESRSKRVEKMFRVAFLPLVRNGAPRGSEGNWDLIMLDAAIGMSVFLDERAVFDQVIAQWRVRVPAYIYHSDDGARPVGPPGGVGNLTAYWHGQTTYVDGLVQETCRDLGHTGWGLEALAQVAETAWIQGVDLYAEAQPRLVSALEFHAGLELGDPVPGWLCGGSLSSSFSPIPENAYNHYHNRMGIEMPRTQELIARERPQRASYFYAWTSLTTGYVP